MRRSIIAVLIAAFLLTVSPTILAGNGVKVETEGLDKYTSVGLDLELGLPGIPLRAMVDVLGWWSHTETQLSHVQAGVGARYYITGASRGLFAEGKVRYIVPFEKGLEPTTVYLAGLGYRLRPLIGGIDIYAITALTEQDMLPKYTFGVRVGF